MWEEHLSELSIYHSAFRPLENILDLEEFGDIIRIKAGSIHYKAIKNVIELDVAFGFWINLTEGDVRGLIHRAKSLA